MEFVPLKFLSRFSAGVPAPARSASVFLTTLYLPPAACTARRSLVSSSTVMPWNVDRMTVETLASSVFSLSRSCCFSLRFFMIPCPQSFPLGLCRGRVCLCLVRINGDARAHGRGQRNLLHILAFGRRGLGFDHCSNQRVGILGEFRPLKLNLSDRAVNNARFVHAEFHFARFGLADGFRHI